MMESDVRPIWRDNITSVSREEYEDFYPPHNPDSSIAHTASFSPIPGVYFPPVAASVRVVVVPNHPCIYMEKMGEVIGKLGHHMKQLTESSGVAYIWYDRANNWFEIWSFRETATVKAICLLHLHLEKFGGATPERNDENFYAENINLHARIAIVPNYPGISFERMRDEIIPMLVPIQTTSKIGRLFYNPYRNWYEVWSVDEERTQVALKLLHTLLNPFPTPPPPPVLRFFRTLDTHDFEKIQNGATPVEMILTRDAFFQFSG